MGQGNLGNGIIRIHIESFIFEMDVVLLELHFYIIPLFLKLKVVSLEELDIAFGNHLDVIVVSSSLRNETPFRDMV